MPKLSERIEEVRERRPFIDHLLRMVKHYGNVKGNQQAGAVTYFGFLSFFPIMALAFAVIGQVARVYPDANDALIEAINGVLPGLVGNREGQIPLSSVQDAAPAAFGIGLLGVLFAGLGWLSALREGLIAVFELPEKAQPNFVLGKLRDLMTLAIIGLVLILSVGVSGIITRFSGDLLDLIGLSDDLDWLLAIIAILVGLGANMVLFFAMFKLLAEPKTPSRALWSGALLGAIGFEILKQLSGVLLASTKGQPAFQAFGIALILLVWINYFSRLVLYAAAWAHTDPRARAIRPDDGPQPVQGPRVPTLSERRTVEADDAEQPLPKWLGPFAGGAAAMLALVGVVRRRG